MSKEYTHYMPAEALGITEEQLQAQKETTKLFGKKGKEWEHFTPEFVDTRIQRVDLNRIQRSLTAAQKTYREVRLGQTSARVLIETDTPITPVFLGDIHYGHIAVDHKRFHQMVERIVDTPGVYTIFMSNMIDNAIPAQYPDGMAENPIPPDQQVVVMRKVAQELNEEGKLLAVVRSRCHEGWTWLKTSQDMNDLLYGFEERKFPVMDNGGMINLRVGRQTYKIAIFHTTGPFESNFNPEHSTRQMNRLQLDMKADVVAAGHKHRGAASMNYEGRGIKLRPVVYIRTGTLKGTGDIQDRFGRDIYGTMGEPTGQAVTLWPNERKMQPHLEFDTAMMTHERHMVAEMMKKLDK